MSVSRWAYLPDRCDGDACPGDCDLCSKAQDNVAMMEEDNDVVDDLIRRADAVALASGGCHPANLAEELAKLPSAHRPTDEWCTDCKEYDTERKCCPRFNRVIREVVPRWIPCSERLPDYNVPVLTWDGVAYQVEKRIPCIIDDDAEPIFSEWWVSDDYDEDESLYYPNLRDGAAIAWMPLPEPYREDGENDG